MEAFSLLKYWRGNGGGANVRTPTPTTTTITAALPQPKLEPEEDDVDNEDQDDEDESSFFDLEFTVPDENDEKDEDGDDEEEDASIQTDEDEDRGFDFTVSSGSSDVRTDPNLVLSPSDGLFFKGKLVPIEPLYNPSEPNSKPPQFPVSLLKSATKFRVFLLRFKKPKSSVESTGPAGSAQKHHQPPSRFFTVKFKIDEAPIVSLFTRDNSSSKMKQQKHLEADSAEEKRFAKVVMQKYLKMIKPLYVKVSRKYGEKVKVSGQVMMQEPEEAAAEGGAEPEVVPGAPSANVKNQKQQGNLPAGLRVACKHLGKSRSASAAVPPIPSQNRRRDDSLLQQQDGIQSAIAHCKRSFNASSNELEISLPRSVSNPFAVDGCSRNSMKGKEACI